MNVTTLFKTSATTNITPAARKAVAARSEGLCEAVTPRCSDKAVHMHHVLRRSHGGPGTPDNLLHVCGPCHVHIHLHPDMSYQAGWLRRGVA